MAAEAWLATALSAGLAWNAATRRARSSMAKSGAGEGPRGMDEQPGPGAADNGGHDIVPVQDGALWRCRGCKRKWDLRAIQMDVPRQLPCSAALLGSGRAAQTGLDVFG